MNVLKSLSPKLNSVDFRVAGLGANNSEGCLPPDPKLGSFSFHSLAYLLDPSRHARCSQAMSNLQILDIFYFSQTSSTWPGRPRT